MAPSNTTPWWERKNANAQSRDGGGDACSIRSSETYSCRTAPDDNGVMRRKCERIVKKFRMCPGRAPEEIENSREETEEDPKGGLFGGGWSTSREWSSETRGGGVGGPTPELPFPFSLFFELDDDSSRPTAEEEARRRRGGGDAREDLLRKNLDELGEELARRGRRRGDPPPPPPRESGSRSFLGDREFRDRHDERTLLDYLLGTKPSKRSERQPSYDDAKRGSREA